MKSIAEKEFSLPTKTKHDRKVHLDADHAMRELDRVKRWKKVHDLLRKNNKKARKEQDVTAKDAKYYRDNRLVRKDKTKIMGLRWGVSLPPTTYEAIVQADVIVNGKSEIEHPDKEENMDLKSTNQIVRDLEKAFPQYRVIK